MEPHSKRFARYAVYWTPEQGDPLAAFGASWLGHDPAKPAETVTNRIRLGLQRDLAEHVIADPRRYGLHATLKAPFRLSPNCDYQQLAAATGAMADKISDFSIPPLRLTDMKGFLALCPSGPAPPLDVLAEGCVTELDYWRAPMSAEDRARRKPDRLSPRQLELLDRWGYPHVLDQFRFHITLTGRLTTAERARIAPLLEAATAPFCMEPVAVRSIALFGDPGDGRPFELVQRFGLSSDKP